MGNKGCYVIKGGYSGLQNSLTQFNRLPDDKILESSKLKQVADNILKCIENEK